MYPGGLAAPLHRTGPAQFQNANFTGTLTGGTVVHSQVKFNGRSTILSRPTPNDPTNPQTQLVETTTVLVG